MAAGFHFEKDLETGVQMFSKSAEPPYSKERRPKDVHRRTLAVVPELELALFVQHDSGTFYVPLRVSISRR